MIPTMQRLVLFSLAMVLTACRNEPTPTAEAGSPASKRPVVPADRSSSESPAASAEPVEPAEPSASQDPLPADADPSAAESAECTATCTPRRLHRGAHPSRLVVDATHLYWVQESKLYRMPREGGEAEVLLDEVDRDALPVDESAIYPCRRASNEVHDVLRMPKAGGPPRRLAKADECRLALVGEHLYFPERDLARGWGLARVPTAGGTTQRLLDLSFVPDEIVTDGEQVYWTGNEQIARFDPKTDQAQTFATGVDHLQDIGFIPTHVAWIDLSNLVMAPKRGPHQGKPEVVANFQHAHDFESDGTALYWASATRAGWQRLELESKALITYAVPEGSNAIAVDGSRVWWTESAEKGGIYTLDTCGCDDDVLVPRPLLRGIEGPEQERPLRYGYENEGQIFVQVRDLSDDEADVLTLLAEEHPDTIPLDAPLVPPRFARGDRYRVANHAGVFEATLVGLQSALGGEGTYLELILEAKGTDAGGIVARADGPKLTPIRDASPDPSRVPEYLPAIRKAVKAARLGHRRVQAEHVRVVPAALPAPHQVVITVAVPLPGSDEDPSIGTMSALLLGGEKGAITQHVLGPEERMESFTVDFLVDIGADGTDEVGFTSAYYEGSYDLLLEWDGHRPGYITLAGDGA